MSGGGEREGTRRKEAEWFRFQPSRGRVEECRHPHRPREDGLAHPADASRSSLADALALLSKWRLSKR
jgi:hypothetical protein